MISIPSKKTVEEIFSAWVCVSLEGGSLENHEFSTTSGDGGFQHANLWRFEAVKNSLLPFKEGKFVIYDDKLGHF